MTCSYKEKKKNPSLIYVHTSVQDVLNNMPLVKRVYFTRYGNNLSLDVQ